MLVREKMRSLGVALVLGLFALVTSRAAEAEKIKFDRLSLDEVEQLRAIYDSTAGTARETYDFATDLGYYVSIFDGLRENREVADTAIRSALESQKEELMPDYRILYCNFMVKDPGQGEIESHQDFSFVSFLVFLAGVFLMFLHI